MSKTAEVIRLENELRARGYGSSSHNEYYWGHPNGRNWVDTRWPIAEVWRRMEAFALLEATP